MIKPASINNSIYYPELDGLRFLAFMLVFVNHQYDLYYVPVLHFFQAKGWIGVNLFFVLSACLFTKLLSAEFKHTQTINFKKFFVRRIFRIWPLYFVYVALCIVLYFFWFGESMNEYVGMRIVGLMSFTDNIMSVIYPGNAIPLTSHLWTISYEEQFYMLIPFIIRVLVRTSVKVRWIAFLAAIFILNLIRLMFIIENVPHPAVWVLPFTNFESIILGIVIGFGGFDFLLKRFRPEMISVAGLFFFLLIYFLPRLNETNYWLIISYTCVGLSTSLFLFSIMHSNPLKRFFSFQPLVFLGKRSFGLYVYHFLGNALAAFLIQHVPGIPSGLLYLVLYSLLITIILSVLSYTILESPFLHWKKRYEIIKSRPI